MRFFGTSDTDSDKVMTLDADTNKHRTRVSAHLCNLSRSFSFHDDMAGINGNFHLRRMECHDLSYVTFTNIQKMHETLMNSKVSKNIRNQGEKLFCWAFAISTMLRQSLKLFVSQLDKHTFKVDDALEKLNNIDFHRQLRNEIIMIPIPKNLSNEFNQNSPLNQGHYVYMAFERVSHFFKSNFWNWYFS